MNVVPLLEKRLSRHLQLEEEARGAFIRRDFLTAIVIAREAVRFGAGCHHAQILLGDICCAMGLESQALQAYHRARRLCPARAEAYWSVSTVHFLAGRWRPAVKYLHQAEDHLRRGDGLLFEWIPEDLAIALFQLGRIDEAITALGRGLRRRPSALRLRELRSELASSRRPGLRALPTLSASLRMLPKPDLN